MPLTLARTRPWPARLLVASLALAGCPACDFFVRPGGPSQVAQGRYYSTGNPDYDEFFVELHRLQVDLKDSPDRVAAPRAALAKTLDVSLDAVEIKEALTKKASELGTRQVKLIVVGPAAPDKPLTLRVTGAPAGADLDLQKAIEEALAKTSELKGLISDWQKQLDVLPGRADKLEGGVDESFVGTSDGKRREIKGNLADAKKIIELLVTRAKDAERSNSELIDALTAGLGEAPAEKGDKETASSGSSTSSDRRAKRTPPPPPPPPAAKPAKAPPSRPAPPPKPAPAPAPKPAPEKPAPKPAPEKPAPAAKPDRGAGELPPAPKPTQGTAKPDFEP
jgi:hypothetical protein